MSYYKKVTLKDIANDSGVSVSSVSMILNKREGVSFSNETVEKVLSSAKKLGYEISSSQKKNGTPAYNTQRSAKYIAIFCPNIQILITLRSHNPLNRLLIKKDLKL